ncbi:MAG: HEPN domain-containing protein [Acidobacteriota bacterium]
MNRKDFKSLALTRLREARVLLANGEYSGAYYLAGYVVECALKACIAKRTKRHDFPDKTTVNESWTHRPVKLIGPAELEISLAAKIKADPVFGRNWANVIRWGEDSRYELKAEREAVDLIKAISDRRHGVLRWLKQHW